MRSQRQQLDEKGDVIAVAYLSYHDTPSDIDQVLGRMGLEWITIKTKEGFQFRYWAWEYECTFCGSYEHKDADCPDLDEDGEPDPRGFMAEPPKFQVGDLVTMHNSEGTFAISHVRPSDAPHRSHKYSVNGNAMEYYESVFTKA